MSTNHLECQKIKQLCKERSIKYLFHYTPISNLHSICNTPEGILARTNLEERKHSNPEFEFTYTDDERRDNRKDLTCCSITYPSLFRFQKTEKKSELNNLIAFLIKPRYIWKSETCFCPANAATDQGKLICNGLECFESLFSSHSVVRNRPRPEKLKMSYPTDIQAEILVKKPISHDSIRAIFVSSKKLAENVIEILSHQEQIDKKLPVCISPKFFNTYSVISLINNGKSVPNEQYQ